LPEQGDSILNAASHLPFNPFQARRRLSDDPLQRLAFVAYIVGSYLRMQEYSANAASRARRRRNLAEVVSFQFSPAQSPSTHWRR
jgi:hypothetical protein